MCLFRKVAKSILRGNFANLSKLDAGYFGAGMYFTLDPDYAMLEYGGGNIGDGWPGAEEALPLVFAATLAGNCFPVIELPHDANGDRNPEGFLGAPFVGASDSHVVLVAKASNQAQ